MRDTISRVEQRLAPYTPRRRAEAEVRRSIVALANDPTVTSMIDDAADLIAELVNGLDWKVEDVATMLERVGR